MYDKMYFNRQGKPVSFEEGMLLFGKDTKLKRTDLKNGVWVSTVFLVINHSSSETKPLIFETMVFDGKDMTGIYQTRYSTEEEALAGHEEAVAKFQDWTPEKVEKVEEGPDKTSWYNRVLDVD